MENENMKIRLAVDDDFEAIFAIWLEGISNSFDTNQFEKEQLKTKFLSNFSQRQGIFNFWVAVDSSNKVWGWQSLLRCLNHPFKENTYAESSTYISKSNRFNGLGTQLLDYAIRDAEKSSLEYIIGFISTANDAAKKITQETGWIEMGIMPPSKKNANAISKMFLVRPV
jgi:L-amino acid N-acyltransferase YncA